jgi:predicted dehydrogenase
MPDLGIGLLGLGYWGLNYVRVLQELEGATLLACADPSLEGRQRARRAHPRIRFAEQADEVLDDPAVGAVVVSTPASTHADLAREVLARGKHVLVEKPLALRRSDAEELGRLADDRGLVCMVAHTFLYNPAVLEARRRILDGDLGDLYYMHFTRTGLGPIRADVDVLWDLAPHDVSIALHLLGEEPASVAASGRWFLRPGVNDLVFLNLQFASGVAAHVHASWLDPRKKREVTIVGSAAMLVLEDTSPARKLTIYGAGSPPVPTTGDFGEFLSARVGDEIVPHIEPREPLREQCEHFVDCVLNHKRPLTDAESGARVVGVLERAQAQLAGA